MLRTVAAIIVAAALSVIASRSAHADGDDLGTTFAGIPLPRLTPSTDQTLRSVLVGSKLLSIPRNYLWSAEKTPAGDWTAPVIEALLPDLVPLTAANRDCFFNYLKPCARDVVTFIFFNDRHMPSAAQQLQQLGRGNINPEPQAGPCDTIFYKAKKTPQPGHIGFEYFLKKMDDDSEPTLLRCAMEIVPHPWCIGYAHAHDITYSYNFDRIHLCEWNTIRTRMDALIVTFQNAN